MTTNRAAGDGTEPLSFQSLSHPKGNTLAAVFGGRYVRPLAATMIPAMIVALVVVLQGGDVLAFVQWSFPVAMMIAAGWTWYRMRTVTVEIIVSPRGARALTAYEAVARRDRARMQRVFDVRVADAHVDVTIGLTSIRLYREEWGELTKLVDSLETARQYYA